MASKEHKKESIPGPKLKSSPAPKAQSRLKPNEESSPRPQVQSRSGPQGQSSREPQGESSRGPQGECSRGPQGECSRGPQVKSSLEQQNDYHIVECGLTPEQLKELAKERLVAGNFYGTNASHHRDIQLKNPRTSPLPSFRRLPSAEKNRDLTKGAKWVPFRVTLDTEISYAKPKTEYVSRWHPCYLANYNPNTNEAIFFMGSSQAARNQTEHRFATVYTSNPGASGDENSAAGGDENSAPIRDGNSGATGDKNSAATGDGKSLITDPANAFRLPTYLNLSHPIKVQPLFLCTSGLNSPKEYPYINEFKKIREGFPEPKLWSEKPIVVGITDFKWRQGLQSVSFEKQSDMEFRKMHMDYHRRRPFPSKPRDRNDGGGDGPNGDRRRSSGHQRSGGRDGGGNGGGGTSREGGGGGVGGGTIGSGGTSEGANTNSGAGTGGNRSSCEGDGSGDGNRGSDPHPRGEEIDEAHEIVRDEAFTTQGVLLLYHRPETYAPWGCTDDGQRIGIDVPLVNDDPSFDDSDQELPGSDDSDQEHSCFEKEQFGSDYSDHKHSTFEKEHSTFEKEHSGSEYYSRPDEEYSSSTEEHSSYHKEHFTAVEEYSGSDDSGQKSSSQDYASHQPPDYDVEKDSIVSNQPSISQSQVQYSPQPEVVEKFFEDLNPDIVGSFAFNLVGFPTRICGLLKRNSEHDWIWKRIRYDEFTSHAFITKEGLYFERCNGIQKVVNLHKSEAIILPRILENDEPCTIRCMAPLENFPEFKVIMGGYSRNTMIYDYSSCKLEKEVAKYPLRDMQEWMTRGGTVVHKKGIVFILYHWRADIVAYFIDDDKWGIVLPPKHKFERGFEPLLCGIGCWNNQIYCSTVDCNTLRIWRLEDLKEDWDWELIHSMGGSDYHWLLHDNDNIKSYIQVRIFASFREEEVIFYSYSSGSSQRLVLFDLENNGPWKRVSLPFKFEAFQVENINPAGDDSDQPQSQVKQSVEPGVIQSEPGVIQSEPGVKQSAEPEKVETPTGAVIRTRMMQSLIDEAVKIIRDVSDKADHVFLNKNQCKWLARRFQQMGQALENDDTSSLEEFALERIRLVLKNGETLVDGYTDRNKALANALSREVNKEAFNEVHKQLDYLKSVLYWSDDENVTEEVAAENDRNAIVQNLENLDLIGMPQVNVINVKRVILDRVHQDAAPDYDLSYLHIDFDAIKLGPPIKELPKELKMGDKHLEGQALVHNGSWNGCDYAIKVFKSSNLQWNMEELQKECASLVKLRHPHITQLIGCAQDQDKTYVLYEKMDGDLRELMKARIKKRSGKPPPFSPTEELSIIRQIAQGMLYLHHHGIFHGELKCTNVLVKQAGDDINVRVSDFYSRELGSNERYKRTHQPWWLPPEAFGHFDLEHPPAHDVLKQKDVYSFAMTCYDVVTGRYLYDGVRVDDIITGKRPKLPYHVSDDLKNLIAECWSEIPQNRPTFREICHSLQFVALSTSTITSRHFPFFGSSKSGSAAAVLPYSNQVWPKLKRESTSKATGEPEKVVEGLPHYLNIEPAKLKWFKKLGRGDSAQVWAVTWIGCKLAVKYLESDHVSKLRHEVDIRMKLLHPHVVRLVGFAAEGNRCAIVMELMDMSLRIFMKEKTKKDPITPFSEAEAIAIITKLALGMDFMHSRGVAHGDLKCANVLVRHVQTKSRNNILDVKLVDFSLAHLGSVVDTKPHIVGRFRAPEVIRSMKSKTPPYDPKAADVYSFGMMCLEIITGKVPYYDKSDGLAEQLAEAGSLPHRPKRIEVRDELWNLLNRCWSVEPERRPKFPEICKILAAMSAKPPEVKS